MTAADPPPAQAARAALAYAPVHLLAGERDADAPDETVGLCLSGGGYRAMLFHAGALLRLNELGLLSRVDRVSAVSGGAVTAAVLGWRWARLEFRAGVARNLAAEVVAPLRALARSTVDVPAIVLGAVAPGAVNVHLADHYRRHLFGPPAPSPWTGRPGSEPTLQDLPDRPRVVLNATNLESGVLWRFSRREMADYRVGRVPAPRVSLARAVAASSAFPPFLSPQRLRVDPGAYAPDAGEFGEVADLTGARYREEVTLSDGGVYDNLGLETAWKRCRTLLVSDGGGMLAAAPDVPADWARQMVRVTQVIDGQVRSLRRRQLVEGFRAGVRDGAYWSIRSTPSHFPVPDPLLPASDAVSRARVVPTRLAALPDDVQEALLDWGYAACDLGIRGHVLPDAPRPTALPSQRGPLPEASPAH
ncbi:MAG TPA: patatin-like phospholipase family protein [Miltoncostaeaceae bacterium]|nr:patatin-like phospholipase family protein [Miltoncostaeaceae bacterium]